MLGGCDGFQRTNILTASTLGGCGGPERIDFQQFLCWEDVVVFKELIFKFLLREDVVVLKELNFNSFYFKRMQWS